VVLHLQAQGLGEGDEHPPMLYSGVWLTLPFNDMHSSVYFY